MRALKHSFAALLAALLAACAAPAPPTPTATPAGPPPAIRGVTADRQELGRYERIELTVDLSASYTSPYDPEQVELSASFSAPSGKVWQIAGFWDGHQRWRVRFTPSEVGAWRYTVRLRDANGAAEAPAASFTVAESARHGWLQVASWRDPALSPRYLAHHDGTPFYGVGACEAFTLGDARQDAAGELNTLKRMREQGANIVVWWPHNTFNFYRSSPTDLDRVDMELIDSYLASAERLGVAVVYTVWDHPQLRGAGHPWGAGSWENNGFRRITPRAEEFFTSEDSWRAQQNLYRYIIARWGYSPSIIWMTVSELNGTSAGDARDSWHARINDYFVRSDPYRHPTTASLSGDIDWPEGFAVMDIPQVHLYEAQGDPVAMGDSVAEWTGRMWRAQARPNFVGEFGGTNRRQDLDLLHNGIWAGLASGAAITPMRWNDRGAWGRMRPPLLEQLGHLARFVEGVPLAQLGLEPAEARADAADVLVRALAGPGYAIVWAQDRSGGGAPRSGVSVSVPGLADGRYRVRPYDTWAGQELPPIEADASGGALRVELPRFERDIALKVEPLREG